MLPILGLGRDHIRSPEWAVRDGRAQLKIVRAYAAIPAVRSSRPETQ